MNGNFGKGLFGFVFLVYASGTYKNMVNTIIATIGEFLRHGLL